MVDWVTITARLKFRREFDGRVVLRVDGEQTYVSAEKWVHVVAALSADGDNQDVFAKVKALHGVGLADGKRQV